jgi:hypothetical protein
VAAITAKIANASFYQTLNRALQICISLFTLMAGVFVRPELVIEAGFGQMKGALLILIATIGITFSLQARFADRRWVDICVRLILAVLALVALLHPNDQVAALACLPIGLIIAYWVFDVVRPVRSRARGRFPQARRHRSAKMPVAGAAEVTAGGMQVGGSQPGPARRPSMTPAKLLARYGAIRGALHERHLHHRALAICRLRGSHHHRLPVRGLGGPVVRRRHRQDAADWRQRIGARCRRGLCHGVLARDGRLKRVRLNPAASL